MRQMVQKAKTDPEVRNLAIDLTARLPDRAWVSEIKALHAFVRDQIRFVRDVLEVETLQTPQQTLAIGAGDCDDKSTLLAALLASIGHRARFVAIGRAPRSFEHVYIEALAGKGWMPLDPSLPWPAGQAPRDVKSRMVVTL